MTAHVDTTLRLLDDIFGCIEPRDFAVRLWEGTSWGPGFGQPARTTLVLTHPGALRRLLWRPTELHFAECYVHGDVDIEGDVTAMVAVGVDVAGRRRSFWDRLDLARRLLRLPATRAGTADVGPPRLHGAAHTLDRDRQAVTSHYDVSNDFYRLWLDREMVYSCAYFSAPDDDLDRAQTRKLDLLCRKLRLRRGERLLDVGCGWGALIRHAAREYGVDATGITLSEPQAIEANARIAAEGLSGRCRTRVVDYRELTPALPFDKIASIGMVEHVGREHLPEYFAQLFALLRPGGAFLNHGIGDLSGAPGGRGSGFLTTYVFPDSELPDVGSLLSAAEDSDFEVRDVESLREHYAATLRHWVRRLEANRERAVAEVGEATYRTWRLYMSGCARWFERGYVSVYQSLLVRRGAGGRVDLPLTRADWYADAVASRAAVG